MRAQQTAHLFANLGASVRLLLRARDELKRNTATTPASALKWLLGVKGLACAYFRAAHPAVGDHGRSDVSAHDCPMTRTDLPREVRQNPLDHHRLVSTLGTIDGERVIVRLASREANNESTAGVASIVAELKHQVPACYEGHEYSIGSPYPDRSPEYLAGGILFIREQTFEAATLTTFDGDDYFIISTRRAAWRSYSGRSSTYP